MKRASCTPSNKSCWSTQPCSVASALRELWSPPTALLEKNPDPSETEVRYWLAGNLCRCTGYDKIIRAVLDAGAVMRGK